MCYTKFEHHCKTLNDSLIIAIIFLHIDPPVILIQPADVELPVNSTAIFSVVASGSELSYQWFMAADITVPLSDSDEFFGVNTPTLIVSVVGRTFFGVFFVNVFNSIGSVDSNLVVLSLGKCNACMCACVHVHVPTIRLCLKRIPMKCMAYFIRLLQLLRLMHCQCPLHNHQHADNLYSYPLLYLPVCPGADDFNPASSCQQILDCDPSSPSGDYWLETLSGTQLLRTCDMNITCGNVTGGWLRIVNVDTRVNGVQCPGTLGEVGFSGGLNVCRRTAEEAGCSEAFFITNTSYSQVCGKVIGYQVAATDTFGPNTRSRGIDDAYLDGVSLTYGFSPRNHIWSFAAGHTEAATFLFSNCPCTNINFASESTMPPNFVGNDYFCDTGTEDPTDFFVYADDPLWDGAGCGANSTCCSFNNPPWFFKEFGDSLTDDIEMRVCRDQVRSEEDVVIQQIELYIR